MPACKCWPCRPRRLAVPPGAYSDCAVAVLLQCRHFKPDYDRLGAYFNQEPRPTPHVTVIRVDCSKEASRRPTLARPIPVARPRTERPSPRVPSFRGPRKRLSLLQGKLCDKFNIKYYPTMLLGPAASLAAYSRTGVSEASIGHT